MGGRPTFSLLRNRSLIHDKLLQFSLVRVAELVQVDGFLGEGGGGVHGAYLIGRLADFETDATVIVLNECATRCVSRIDDKVLCDLSNLQVQALAMSLHNPLYYHLESFDAGAMRSVTGVS